MNISIEELINGEKDNSESAKEKALITSIKEREKVKKKSKRLFVILSIISFIIISFLIFYNLKAKINLVNDSDYLYDEVISFLKKKEFVENPDSKYEDFNVFYSYYGFGIEKENRYKYVYMWIYNSNYYIESAENGGALALSTSNSIPLKAIFKDNILQDIVFPKDGNEYTSSIKKMFPSIIGYQVLHFNKEKNINKLFNEVENKKNIYYNYLNLDMSKITIDDLVYDNLVFSIEYKKGKCNIPIELNVFKNNKYSLYTKYKACKKGQTCNQMLQYTDSIEGKYEFDIIEIIRHSIDANLHQYTNDNIPEYIIRSGKGHEFITDSNNKYLKEFTDSINVDLKQCAKPDYDN